MTFKYALGSVIIKLHCRAHKYFEVLWTIYNAGVVIDHGLCGT